MLDRIREIFAKPAVGWSVAGIAILIAGVVFFRSLFSSNTYDLAKLSENVTVHFTDTNEEIVLPRGEFERQLRGVAGILTKEKGIVNPKTGKPTGILVAAKEWNEVIDRMNAEREWSKENSPFGAATGPQKPAGSK